MDYTNKICNLESKSCNIYRHLISHLLTSHVNKEGHCIYGSTKLAIMQYCQFCAFLKNLFNFKYTDNTQQICDYLYFRDMFSNFFNIICNVLNLFCIVNIDKYFIPLEFRNDFKLDLPY